MNILLAHAVYGRRLTAANENGVFVWKQTNLFILFLHFPLCSEKISRSVTLLLTCMFTSRGLKTFAHLKIQKGTWCLSIKTLSPAPVDVCAITSSVSSDTEISWRTGPWKAHTTYLRLEGMSKGRLVQPLFSSRDNQSRLPRTMFFFPVSPAKVFSFCSKNLKHSLGLVKMERGSITLSSWASGDCLRER